MGSPGDDEAPTPGLASLTLKLLPFWLMDRNFSQGLVAGSAFSKSRLDESRLCKSTRSSRRFNALEASTRYEGISFKLVLRISGSEVIEELDTVEADLELLYEVRRESYISALSKPI